MVDEKIVSDNGVTPAPVAGILFKPASWLSQIDFITQLILFNNILISVLSEHCGGKTSFSSILSIQLDSQIKSVLVSGDDNFNRESLIKKLCVAWQLNAEENTTFEAVACTINERKTHVVLIIDDAHLTPLAVIKEILSVIKNQKEFGYFHVCMVADYSVIASLNNLAIDEYNNLIHTIEIGSLNETEARTYVLQRAVSHRLIHRPLSDAQFKQFYQLTKGSVAQINNTLEQFITQSPIRAKSKHLIGFLNTSLVLGILGAMGITYVYLSKPDYAPVARRVVTNKLPDSPLLIANRDAIESQLESEIVSWNTPVGSETIHSETPLNQASDDVSSLKAGQAVALIDKEASTPKATIHRNKKATKTDAKKENAAQKSSIKPRAKNKVTAKALRSGQYAIQLAASHRLDDIHRFRKKNQLQSKTAVRRFVNNQGTWYILTYGAYNNRNEASKKLNSLPSDIARLKPWVRALSGLAVVG
jgi:cell division septation protein DedD